MTDKEKVEALVEWVLGELKWAWEQGRGYDPDNHAISYEDEQLYIHAKQILSHPDLLIEANKPHVGLEQDTYANLPERKVIPLADIIKEV